MKGETGSTIVGSIATANAGTLRFDWANAASGIGGLNISAEQFPVALIGHPSLGGPAYAAWGATGAAQVALKFGWKSEALDGTSEATIAGLQMKPTAQAPAQAAQLAKALDRLKGRPVVWPVKLGGTITAPAITDSGLDSVLKSALTEAAKAEFDERKNQAIDLGMKHLDQHLPGSSTTAKQILDGVNAGGLTIPGISATNPGAITDLVPNTLPGISATTPGSLKDRLKIPTFGR